MLRVKNLKNPQLKTLNKYIFNTLCLFQYQIEKKMNNNNIKKLTKKNF
jgi:hypothetical protein